MMRSIVDIYEIIREAETTVIKPKTGTSSDYSPESSEDESTDYTVQKNEVTSEEEISNQDEESTDYTEDVPTEEEDTEDSDVDNTESANDESNPLQSNNQKALLDDYMGLYYSLGSVIGKLSDNPHPNIIANKVVYRVKSNIIELRNYIYDYIINQFENSSYPKNLLVYNEFISTYLISAEMLKKVKMFGSPNQTSI